MKKLLIAALITLFAAGPVAADTYVMYRDANNRTFVYSKDGREVDYFGPRPHHHHHHCHDRHCKECRKFHKKEMKQRIKAEKKMHKEAMKHNNGHHGHRK